jgi:hypothetical protein
MSPRKALPRSRELTSYSQTSVASSRLKITEEPIPSPRHLKLARGSTEETMMAMTFSTSQMHLMIAQHSERKRSLITRLLKPMETSSTGTSENITYLQR